MLIGQGSTLGLTAADHALTCHWSLCLGDDRILTFLVIIVVEIHDDPIICSPELVCPGCVGEQCREVPFPTIGMQDGQPCESFRIETIRRDLRQFSGGRAVPILPIDIKQHFNRRRHLWRLPPAATTTEQRGEARLDYRRAPGANSRNGGEPTVVCSNLQCFERINM